ncbi:hypothetical protein B4U80_07983 [Leptotrombidium deliense]|uniref:Integrase catalytic domain-containing protein n=1 Tax=Leptotrombidium deliense TaxID=299467 RepID=A0A443SIV5_9ACAR|nr:hypothetical protein B4U80_07983 [Leptotrombidium deliense]
MIKQLKIILKLAKINGYDENGRIRNKHGMFIENSSLIQLLSHAMAVGRVLLAEKEFIELLNEANIDSDLIVNDNVRAKLAKLKENKQIHVVEPVISETIDSPQNQSMKRKRDYDEEDEPPPILDKYDQPPRKRTREEAENATMPMNEDKINVLHNIYYNPRNSCAFSTAVKLYLVARLKAPTLTLKEVKEWLSGELTYTLHKPVRRNFKRNKIIVQRIDEQWQADLVDMQEFHSQNDGFKYILTVVDCFSKYAWAVALKTKSAVNVAKAFETILLHRQPFYIQTDNGKEFLNKEFKKLITKKSILHFTSKNEKIKCAVVERFNRTLKTKMFKYFTSKGTRRYIDILQQLIDAYNETKHSVIKMKPVDVNYEIENYVFKNIYGSSSRRTLFKNRPILPKGATVRRQYKPKTFDKGYYPNWTDAVYTIEKAQQNEIRPTYKITSEKGQLINKTFYPEEIQRISTPLFRIEKFLKKRKRNGVTEYFVKFLNHSDEYNEWIPEKDVIKL